MNKKEIKKKYKLRKRELCDAYDRDVQLLRDRLDGELDAAREEYFASRAEYYRSIGKEPPKDPPKRGILEEIGNAVTHGAGSLFAIVAFILMLRAADAPIEYVAASVYFFGLFVMFTMSCLVQDEPYPRRFRILLSMRQPYAKTSPFPRPIRPQMMASCLHFLLVPAQRKLSMSRKTDLTK